MDKKRIGVTTYDRDRNINDLYVPKGYLDGIGMHGGEPVAINYPMPEGELEALTGTLDGVLFSGGPDVEPFRFGAVREPECGRAVEERDELELALLRLAMARELPILGICRGIQLINVGLGGTLVQDIPTRYGENHQQPDGETFWHEVRLRRGTMLHALYGVDAVMTNSYHHQCIDRLAPGLIVNADLPGGMIEGVELPGYRFLMAVQWHPEVTLANDEVSHRVFKGLIGAC